MSSSSRRLLFGLPPSLRPILSSRIHSTATSSRASSSANNSVDSSEVDHFNALASSWWDPHGPSRLLHLMNPLRHSFIDSCLRSQPDPPDPKRRLHYLDVGCGGGIFAESAARLRNTASVTGIDPSSEVLAVAKDHARRDPALSEDHFDERSGKKIRRLRYLNMGIEELKLPDAEEDSTNTREREVKDTTHEAAQVAPAGGYDILTLFEVIEHVSNPSAFLDVLLGHVKPGGWIVLSTIARTWTSWMTTKIMAENVLRIVPSGTHDWNKYINEEEIRMWFEKQNTPRATRWTNPRAMGVVYIPGLGWREVPRAEEWGNYFFAVRKGVGGAVSNNDSSH